MASLPSSAPDGGAGALPPPRPASDRRAFLTRAAATATVALLWTEGVLDLGRRRRTEPTEAGAPRRTLTDAEWRALDAASRRILPSSPDEPGAAEVNAVGYLDAVLADPDIERDTIVRIREGAALLDAFAREQGASSFASLPEEAQDDGLRSFETVWERQLWLRSMIALVMEAFLGDPTRGANPEGIGWAWAGNAIGYPRPKPGWKPLGEGPER